MKKVVLEILKKYLIYGTSKKTYFPEVLDILKGRKKIKWEGDDKKKINLANTLKGVKSYIAIGFPYPTFFPKLLGKNISCYTTINDYHKVLSEELRDTVEKLRDTLGGNYKILVDSSRVFEKLLAVNAGIGFFGKNTLVINREYGSFFFIGIILTDLELPVFSSHEHNGIDCGGCSICERSCPNYAIKNYIISGEKCISYITSADVEGFRYSYIWGCDICQIVCPFNIKRKKNYFERFKYSFNVKLTEVENKEDFEKYSDKLALNWQGFDVFKKNL